jgi:hypothetical protein
MQVRNDRSTGQFPTSDEHVDLLYCRMAMLGLDLQATACGDRGTFDKMQQRCKSCGFWAACAVDLKRDPSASVWEAYCPNSPMLNALSSITEILGRSSLGPRTAPGN